MYVRSILVKLSSGQFERLSELFIDLAKGVFLATIAVPAVVREATILESIRTLMLGLFFTYLSLVAEKLKEVEK